MAIATQLSLLYFAQPKPYIVNVASVPQRSIFRYPGGKTWLVPYIRQWLLASPTRPRQFFEPFAGGGIVGLTVAFEKLADHVTLVELDEQVAAVWKTLIEGDGTWLANQIVQYQLTPENIENTLSTPAPTICERAFQTILKNRINRGGLLAPGAGRVKQGEGGKGLHSRWYPETLRERILNIVAIRDRLTFIHGDGIQVLQHNATQPDAAFFIDPPYTAGGKKAGSRLYLHAKLDHEELFQAAARIKGDFLMTYDDAPEVRLLAKKHGFACDVIPMKSTHHTEMFELLIGRSLDWLHK